MELYIVAMFESVLDISINLLVDKARCFTTCQLLFCYLILWRVCSMCLYLIVANLFLY